MTDTAAGRSKGLLNPQTGRKHFQLSQSAPSPELSFFIEHYWTVEWDLRGQPPYVSENLPYPSVHVVVNTRPPASAPAPLPGINPGTTGVYGVVTGKFAYLLEGQGCVLGIKFRPGAFYPFLKSPVSRLVDRSVPLREVFGAAGDAFEAAVGAAADSPARVGCAEDFLRGRLPERDDTVTWINQVIERIAAERAITKVEDVAGRFSVSARTLQRVFSRWVGVSPKWVIKRARLHEAAERVAAGQVVDWPGLALELGYFDQAHFVKDFKLIVGKTPAEYARQVGEGA